MANIVEQRKQEIDRALASSLAAAESIITKSYLDKLERYSIVRPSEEDIDIDAAECGQFYRVSKLVFNKDERFLDKLTTIVNVAHSIDGTIASIIKSDGDRVDYYIGVLSKNHRQTNEASLLRRQAASAAFHGAIQGNLIGSDVTPLQPKEVERLQESLFANPDRAVASISGVVALRDGDQRDMSAYVQGIEHLVDSLRGQRYAIVLIADPIGNGELQAIRQGYELLYTQLSAFWRTSLTTNENSSVTMSQAQTEGIANGITTGIALTQSKNRATGKFGMAGAGFGVGFGIMGVNASVSAGLSSSHGESVGESKQRSEMEQTSRSSSTTKGTALAEGSSLQLNFENRSVKALLDKIDRHLERLNICESFGAFQCAAYVIADDRNAALTVSSNYNALMRGEESSVQSSFINTWHKKNDVGTLLAYLNSFVHPRFLEDKQGTEEGLYVTPASVVNGNEMAIQIGLPKKSVAGITVIPMAPFGRNVREVDPSRALPLGDLYHMGRPDGAKVTLDVQSLAAHTFVTGSTGSGKSNTVYQLLAKLEDKGVSFLVIEPAKGEYKHVLGVRPDVNVWGTNASMAPLLRINPFAFPAGIHVLEHIDRLIDIFNVCWPMYAAMPAVLKEAIEDAYRACGWDLIASANPYGGKFFPSFADVMESLNKVISQSAYSDELKSNYRGALLTRVRSLTNGLNGQMLCSGDTDPESLFDRNTIVDLSRVGSSETKSLIMGVLVMRLQEHRMTQGGMNRRLRHVTVLEEAHHLLKRTSAEQSADGANLLGKSVEMLANAIAEMRTYGEGFLIADQAPGLLDASVIRNTNTKIVLQTPDLGDRQLVGRSANLNDEQIDELAKLPAGVAAVYQNNWPEPVLCRMEPYASGEMRYSCEPQSAEVERQAAVLLRKQLLELLLHRRLNEKIDVDIDRLEAALLEAETMSPRLKIKLARMLKEYRETQRLAVWEKKRFAQLTALVAAIVGERQLDDWETAEIAETDELEDLLDRVIGRTVGEAGPRLRLLIGQCLLSRMSERSERWLELYYSWDYNMRERLG